VAVLNAAIAAAYYLRVISAMYFRSPNKQEFAAQRAFGPAVAVAVCVALTIGIGLLPGRVLDCAIRAGQSIGQPPAQQASAHPSDDHQSPAPSIVAHSGSR
jgi:NADH-quinone oxidoreductase subunit N